MAVGQVTARTRVLAADHNSLVNLLQGASGETLAFLLRVAASNNFTIVLSDNAGARKFSVKDSDSVEIFSVDSNGNIANSGTYSPTTLVLPQSAAPAPTAEGDIRWDTDDHRIVVGDGATTKTFYPGLERATYKYKTADQSVTDTNLVTITATSGNLQFAVAANSAYEIFVDLFFSAVGAAATDGIQLACTFPAAPTYAHVWYAVPYRNSDATVQTGPNGENHAALTSGTAFFSQPFWSNGASQGCDTGWTRLKIIFINGSTAGDVVFQFAQNANGAGTTTISEAVGVMRAITAEA